MIRTTETFKRRPVEKYCSLAHIATDRIFETFDVSGTPDKNRVASVVDDPIEHVKSEAAVHISAVKAYEVFTGRKHGER
jgi:hypothetical protein